MTEEPEGTEDPDATQEFDPIKDDDDQDAGSSDGQAFRCQPRWEAPVVMVEPTPMREVRRPPDEP